MMDPETIRLAQEQMSRIPPSQLLRMQQQMFSNPDIMRMVTEEMKNMKPEDLRFAAEQMKNMPPEQIARMANATPEQIAAMNLQPGAQRDYEYQCALLLKNQGNQLHGSGQFHEAITKYLKAKETLAGATSEQASSLRVACSLNLMSCYLKTSQYNKVIKEGSEVLAVDPKNLKALYRRGQAYKEMQQLNFAVSDLTEAAAIAPDDETVAEVLRQTKEELDKREDTEPQGHHDGPIIEEITEEEAERLTSATPSRTEDGVSAEESIATREASTSGVSGMSPNDQAYAEALNSMKQNPDLLRNMQSVMSSVDPEQISALSGGKVTSEMAKLASNLMKNMSPSDLERMVSMASNMKIPSGGIPTQGSGPSQPTTASPPPTAPLVAPQTFAPDMTMPPGADEQIRNQMKNPAMRELMSSMIKSMTPESMASMSEQFGLQLTPEQAVEAQKAMSNLSPDQLDKLMRWAERAQTVTEQARRAKAWLLGKQGLILALVMLLLAIVLHYFGFIGR